MRKRLSVAMIVKNESRVIARCLSALEAVQDISAGTFIYDTGSTDGSIEIARALGATVVEGDWPCLLYTSRCRRPSGATP